MIVNVEPFPVGLAYELCRFVFSFVTLHFVVHRGTCSMWKRRASRTPFSGTTTVRSSPSTEQRTATPTSSHARALEPNEEVDAALAYIAYLPRSCCGLADKWATDSGEDAR